MRLCYFGFHLSIPTIVYSIIYENAVKQQLLFIRVSVTRIPSSTILQSLILANKKAYDLASKTQAISVFRIQMTPVLSFSDSRMSSVHPSWDFLHSKYEQIHHTACHDNLGQSFYNLRITTIYSKANKPQPKAPH